MTHPLRILLLDDNPDDRALVVRELNREFPDLQINEATDAAELAEMLERGGFDLVITDYQLRWADGLSVLQTIKARWPDCPVIMFTGTGNEEVAVEAMKAGLEDYVLKSPRHFARLPASVKLALEQARHRQAMKVAELRYRDLFEGVPIGLYRSTPEGLILDANPALVQRLGYPDRESLLAVNLAEIYVNPDDRRTWQALIEREGVVRNFETQMRRRDGEVIWVGESARIIRDRDGQVLYYEGSIEDITARKRVEDSLRRAEAQYRSLVDNAVMGIYRSTPDGRFLFVNPALARIMGYETPEELMTSVTNIAHIYVDPEQRAEYQRMLEERDVLRSYENQVYRKDGSTVWMRGSARAIRDDQGRVLYYEGTVEDITEQKQAEASFKETTEKLEALVQASPAAITVLDPEGNVMLWSPGAERLFGWTEQEVLGRPLPTVPPEKIEEFRQLRDRVLAGVPFTGVEVRRQRKDGSLVDVNLSTAPLYDPQGRIYSIVGVMVDVSERKRAEAALGESQRRYEALVNSIDGIVWEADPQTFQFRFVSKKAEQLLGYPVERWITEPTFWADHIHPEDREWTIDFCVRATQERRDHQFEYRMIAADGRAVWLRDYVTVIVETDQVVGIRGVMVDVSERKLIEEVLAIERERLAVTLQSISDGIVVMDAQKQIIMANPTGMAYLSYLTTARVGEVLTQLGERELEELLRPPLDGRRYHEVAVAGPPKLVFEVAAYPMKKDPEADGWVLVVRDVTAEEEIRQRIQTQERLAAVGQLAAGIAHDFNNILTVIIGLADLLNRDLQLPERTRTSLGVIFEQGKRAAGLIRQILDFSRKSLSQKKSLDLVPLLKETTKFMRTVIPEDIQLELQMEPGEYVINADPAQIQQVVTNLIVNARDAMSEQGGRLTLDLSRRRLDAEDRRPFPDMPPGEWIVLTVADTGTGIAAEALPHIFEPFFTTKEVGQGTGLGLAQVYGIVKQHDGFIDLETEVGKGTTFIIYLPPVESAKSEPVEETGIEYPHGHGELILLVEDEEQVLEVGREILAMLGYCVITARNGREALRLYLERGEEIALIITDMTMPEMGGLQLVQALQMRGSQVKVVVLSGYPLVEGWQGIWGDNVVAWVSKPLRLNEIAEVIHRALTGEAKT